MIELAPRPTVSFLIPVYNAETTLAASLRSALDQTRPADEILVIDDGSTDASAAILRGFDDPRIRVVTQANQGLAETLNRGIALIGSTYIARLDSDDVALPERLERQLAFMEANPQVALLGTWAQIYAGDVATDRYHRHATDAATVQLDLLFDNPFVHSSIIMRTAVVKAMGGYQVVRNTRFPEDYDLWSRTARQHQVANLAEVLTVYREMPNSITRQGAEEILDNVISISAENLKHGLPNQSEQTCQALARLYHGRAATAGDRIGLGAIRLWRRAAIAVGGPPRQWTPEFLSRYRLAQRRLLVQSVRRALPSPVSKILRQARQILRTKT